MSRRGCPYDNALMENFFGTFKTECLYRRKPATGEQVQQLVDEYIQFYNYERIDMKYGLTPFEIRSKAARGRQNHIKLHSIVFAKWIDNEQLKAYNDFQPVCTQNKKRNGEEY